jgi:hypothetical protein
VIARRRWGWDPFLTFHAVGGLMLGFVGLANGFYENGRGVVLTRWKSIEELERHFARFAGASCDGYPVGGRRFFSPEWEAAGVSPPDILPTLLAFHVLEDVPPQFRGFVGP